MRKPQIKKPECFVISYTGSKVTRPDHYFVKSFDERFHVCINCGKCKRVY
jgi:hypothetical protein